MTKVPDDANICVNPRFRSYTNRKNSVFVNHLADLDQN